MFHLSRKVEYALMALGSFQLEALKLNPRLLTAKDQAALHRIPLDVAAKVLQTLAAHKILKVQMGAHGGYWLGCELSELSLYDLCMLIERKKNLIRSCHQSADNKGCAHESYCAIKAPVSRFNQQMEQFLRSISVAQLCAPKEQSFEPELRNEL